MKSLFGMGVITPNQMAKIEGFPTYAQGGDDHYILTQVKSIESGVLNNKTDQKVPPSI